MVVLVVIAVALMAVVYLVDLRSEDRLLVILTIFLLLFMAVPLGTVKIPNEMHTSKRFNLATRRDVDAIAGVLKAGGVAFQRLGPGEDSYETFVIGSEGMTIVVRDLLTMGLDFMVGPVDQYNRVSAERLQRLVDGALAPPHHHDDK